MSWPNTKAIGKFGDRGFIQESFLDKTHTARHRRCSSAPRGASWCRLGAAAKAWPEACPLRGGCRTKEQDIRRSGGSHRTDWTAIDPCSSNAREKYAIEPPDLAPSERGRIRPNRDLAAVLSSSNVNLASQARLA